MSSTHYLPSSNEKKRYEGSESKEDTKINLTQESNYIITPKADKIFNIETGILKEIDNMSNLELNSQDSS